ncbi:PH domain-containing protein, partial [Staphylococcus haemolyticus]
NTIELVTAGHEISLPMVSEKEADVIEHQALNRLRGVDDDV